MTFTTRTNKIFKAYQSNISLLLLCVLLLPNTLTAQTSDLKLLGDYKRIEIPFDLENNFMIVNILMGGIVPVRFIIDTGAENTVLLEKNLSDLLNVSYRRTFRVRGSDINTTLVAHLATGVDLRIANRILARRRSILVLQENYFDFESITGTSIQGILGADFLMRFICEFDYRRQILTLHEPGDFRLTRRHVEIPADFVNNRPYLDIPIGVNQQQPTPRRLLLDTGASLSLLLNTYGDSTRQDLPAQSIPSYIATGLGGSLKGSVGRSRVLKIGGKELEGVITYFQPIDTVGKDFLNQREGLIGNRILRRFTTVIDYAGKRVYLRPGPGAWKRKFRYDRSGLSVVAGGKNLRTFTVANIIPGSPADQAGIQVGDRLMSLNGNSVTFMSLGGIIRRLEGKVGKRIKIRYRRKGEYTVTTFELRDLI